MASASLPYFHPRCQRADAEARLRAAAAVSPPGQVIFLVRNSSSKPNDFVISSISAGVDKIRNLIVSVDESSGRPTYRVEIHGTAQPGFHTLDDLINHYRAPGSGLSGGPLAAYVSAPDEQEDYGLATPKRTHKQPTRTQAAPAPAPAPVQQPAAHISAANHPSLVAPHSSAIAPAHSVPKIGLSEGSSGVHRDPKARVDEGRPEELLCEGYLTKIRGVGQNRKRFFRLTNKKLGFYSKDSGDIIDNVNVSDISAVTDITKTRMRVITRAPFGSSNTTEMILEAPNQRIKQRWLHAFRQEENPSGGYRGAEGVKLCEGYLTKVQPAGTTSKTRWFVVTDQHFAYYKEEASEIMGSVPISNITNIAILGDKEFKVTSNERFTVTGAYEVLCRAESRAARNKWIAQFQRVIPATKFQK